MQLKEIEIIRTQSKIFNPKLKTPNDTSFRLDEENRSDTLFDGLVSILTVLVDRVETSNE